MKIGRFLKALRLQCDYKVQSSINKTSQKIPTPIVCSLVWPPVGKWREEMADISD